jgi:hypothetical protein
MTIRIINVQCSMVNSQLLMVLVCGCFLYENLFLATKIFVG